MARAARRTNPGCAHYVQQEGAARCVFRSDEDCLCYLEALHACARREGVWIHGYVLLPGSARLLLAPATALGLSRCMQELSRRYARWFNARYLRKGAVWRGRYRSCAIAPGLELECCRYLEGLPVKEGLAVRACRYLWSSAPHHAGFRRDEFLSDAPDFQLAGAGVDGGARWQGLLEAPLPERVGRLLEQCARRGSPFSPEAQDLNGIDFLLMHKKQDEI